MVIEGVKLSWLFVTKPDENDKFRATFEVTAEQDKLLQLEIKKIADAQGYSKLDWRGSRKVENGIITYGAKTNASFKNKKGETVTIESIPVYDKYAQRLEVPAGFFIKNGASGSISINPYAVEYKGKKGVMFGLDSIQLIDYEFVQGAGHSNPFKSVADNGSPFK